MDINPKCAYLYADTPPDEAQLEALLKFLKKRHNIEKLEYFRDENIKGGFKMTAGDRLYVRGFIGGVGAQAEKILSGFVAIDEQSITGTASA